MQNDAVLPAIVAQGDFAVVDVHGEMVTWLPDAGIILERPWLWYLVCYLHSREVLNRVCRCVFQSVVDSIVDVPAFGSQLLRHHRYSSTIF